MPGSALDCVNAWYSEISMYDFKNPGWNSNVGHFTQVIWNDSTRLGMGFAIGSGRFFCVGQYLQAGNNLNAFADNVFPLK